MTPREELRQALLTTFLVQLLSTATALALTAIATTAAVDFGVRPYFVGYQISLIYFAGIFSSALAGSLVHRFGPVRIEIACCLLFALGLVLLASARLTLAVPASISIGLGYGLQNPAAAQILSRVAPPHRRNLIFSIKQSGVPMGGVVASLVLPFVARAIGWQASLLLLAMAPILLAIAMARHPDPGRSATPEPAPLIAGLIAEQQLIWRSATLRTIALIGLLFSAVQLSVSAFAVLMLVSDAGWSLIAAGGVAALLQAGGACGRIAWGLIADRIGSGFAVMVAIGLGGAGLMACLPWLATLPGVGQIALLGLLGFGVSGWNGVLIAETARYAGPGQAGRAVGGSLVLTFVGVMIGPSLFATLYTRTGHYGVSFAIFAGVMLGGAALAAWQLRRHPRLAVA